MTLQIVLKPVCGSKVVPKATFKMHRYTEENWWEKENRNRNSGVDFGTIFRISNISWKQAETVIFISVQHYINP